jgi:hypothetical protein
MKILRTMYQKRVIGFWSHEPETVVKQTGARKYVAPLSLLLHLLIARHWVFSNWAHSRFTLDDKQYISTEQRMMEQKACLFASFLLFLLFF